MLAAVALSTVLPIESNLLFKWVGFTTMTALVFGDAIRINRRCWRQRRFWLLLAVFFGAQCGLALVILGTVTKVPTIFWVFLIPLDYAALGAYLGFFLELQRD